MAVPQASHHSGEANLLPSRRGPSSACGPNSMCGVKFRPPGMCTIVCHEREGGSWVVGGECLSTGVMDEERAGGD